METTLNAQILLCKMILLFIFYTFKQFLNHFFFLKRSKKKTRARKKAVKSGFICYSSGGGTLQATGRCATGIDSSKSASCGPSFKYDESSGKCKQIFNVEKPSQVLGLI